MKQVVININQNIASNLNLDYGLDWYQMLMIHDEVQLHVNLTYKSHTERIIRCFPQLRSSLVLNVRSKVIQSRK